MFFRYSLKNAVRSKGKTTLFFVLIVALTLILALGVSVWASIEGFIAECKDKYTTIGLVEYMGEDYPTSTIFDAQMMSQLNGFGEKEMMANEHALQWVDSNVALGKAEGFFRADNAMANRRWGVIIVSGMRSTYAYLDPSSRRNEEERVNAYYGVVKESLYSFTDRVNHLIYFTNLDFVPEPTGLYLLVGEFVARTGSYEYFTPMAFTSAVAAEAGVDLSKVETCLRLGDTKTKDYVVPQVYKDIAQTMYDLNNAVIVTATSNLDAVYEFNQQRLFVDEGRAFTAEEYAFGAKVCLVPRAVADRCGITIGDTLDLSVVIRPGCDLYDSYYSATGFTSRGEYEIVGLLNDSTEYSMYVYVPQSKDIDWAQMQLGYTIGQVVIDNDYATEYYTQMSSDLPNRVVLTVFDQGYSSVVTPLRAILRIAKIVTIVCASAALAVLVLFGFLFVFRQREASLTMLALGTRRGQVLRYFVYGSGAIAVVAAMIGSGGGFLLSDLVARAIGMLAEQFKVTDSRYSDGALTAALDIKFSASADWRMFAGVAAAVILLSMLLCIVFALLTFRESKPRKRNAGPTRARRSSVAFGGRPIKYSLLSLLRSGMRSLVVPLLAVVIVCFLGQLVGTSQKYAEKLYDVNAATDIDGHFTDVYGRRVNGLVVEGKSVYKLLKSGYITDLALSYNTDYRFSGVSKYADGRPAGDCQLRYPERGFALENYLDAFTLEDDIVFTNSIRKTGEFFYSNSVEFTFLDGYDESVFAAKVVDNEYCGVMSTAFMQENGISLGDTVRLNVIRVSGDREAIVGFDVKIVGSFVKQLSDDNVYCQLSAWFDTGLFDLPLDGLAEMPQTLATRIGYANIYYFRDGVTPIPMTASDILLQFVFRSVSFTVPDAFSYTEFRDTLSGIGFSAVNRLGSVREFVVMSDRAYNETTSTLQQQIVYVKILYPLLYALVGVIAFVASYLLIIGRKKEFAIMRGIGADKKRTFFTFFWEQALLCALGCVIGLVGWFVYDGPLKLLHLILTGCFVACYFIGCAISVRRMNNSTVLSILTDED